MGSSKGSKSAWVALRHRLNLEFRVSGVELVNLETKLRMFIEENADWIEYTMLDMVYYAHKLYPDFDLDTMLTRREVVYAERMENQAAFLTYRPPSLVHPSKTVIDLGCGVFQYAIELIKAWKPEKYIGIDKRNMEKYKNDLQHHYHTEAKVSGAPVVSFEQFTVENVNSCWEFFSKFKPDTIFMGEFLHCLKQPLAFLTLLCTHIPTLNNVVIVEPIITSEYGLSSAMSYHMDMHGGSWVTSMADLGYVATCVDFSLEEKYFSSQHGAYIYSRIAQII